MASTIAAAATAPGRGGVGIVRLSGPLALAIAQQVIGFAPKARYAHYCPFRDATASVIDEGICLFFPGPHSFTGEDVVEFQAHGGPVILDMLLETCISHGASLAKPGEFSERAFLNDKLDLAQAEAIADLIAASSRQAAKQALNSLQGAFSTQINTLVAQLIDVRVFVEAAIDFPEEEIDFLSDGKIADKVQALLKALDDLLKKAAVGQAMQEGIRVVLAGKPNAGKSSLLNALADKDAAIVTDIPGTTRDVLRELIHVAGMPVHLSDTAGIRHSDDPVEALGIAKAWQEIRGCDRILLLVQADATGIQELQDHWGEILNNPDLSGKVSLVFNKLDLNPSFALPEQYPQALALSAKTGTGVEQLKAHLHQLAGLESAQEGGFSARRRHINALKAAQGCLTQGLLQLEHHRAGELLAEDLRSAQDALGEITGKVTSDALLGHIFGSFCIGK